MPSHLRIPESKHQGMFGIISSLICGMLTRGGSAELAQGGLGICRPRRFHPSGCIVFMFARYRIHLPNYHLFHDFEVNSAFLRTLRRTFDPVYSKNDNKSID